MADASLHELNYGRPGLAIYELDDRDWNISRKPTSSVLQQVAEWQLAIPAAISNLPTKPIINTTTSRKDVKHLTQAHRQLAPATKQLPDLNVISEATVSASSTYDPQVGDLLSFGTIFLKQFVRPKRIAALPTGPSGSILRLVPLAQQRQGWEGDKSVWLSGPSFRIVDSGYWNEEAVPIQQICFAQSESSDSFLAVRLPTKTVLFRPSYHRGRRAANLSSHYDLPPSLLSARPVIHLTINQTGGVPHAHVAFNPDYQFQLGIIDQKYEWSVWQIERRAKREEYNATRMVAGSVLTENNDTSDGDGWARLLWIGDSNTLVVCNRRHLSVVSLNGGTYEYLESPPIISKRSTDWILDIKRHPHHQNRFFVLTSTRLFLVAVNTTGAAINSTAGHAGATVLLSRRHYRGDEDITLRMSVQALDECVYLFMASSLNKVVLVYHFQDGPSSSVELVTTSDPVNLGLSLPTIASISQMHLQQLEYGTKTVADRRPKNEYAQSYFQKATPFYQLTIILADLSVFQTVMLSSAYDSNPQPLAWRRVVVAKHSLDARTEVDELDGFVEPNGPNWDADPESKLGSQAMRLISSSNRPIASAIANNADVYDALVSTGDRRGSISLTALTDQLRGMMRGGDEDSETRHFMDAFPTLDVSDVDEGSAAVDQLFVDDDEDSTYRLRPIAASDVLHIPQAEQISVANLYDTILQDWIASLPAEVSVPVRQTKERLARRVAAEVTLANTHLRSKGDEQSSVAIAQPLSLPILPSKSADSVPSSLPTPPQSSVPPSSPLFPDFIQPPTNDPLSRLRKHLAINDEASMTPTVLPPSVSELLSHWQPGVDPSLYDWEATERLLRPEAPDDEGQELRERERKKKERRDKRQRREDELLRAKAHTSSQPAFAPPPVPRSSPGPMFGGMVPSSQVPVPTSSQLQSQLYGHAGGFGGFSGVNSIVPQSQVEPGKFGGRPDKKKKKGKSRVTPTWSLLAITIAAKEVCKNTAAKSEAESVSDVATLRQSELPTADVQRGTKKRKRSSSKHGQRVKQEDVNEDDIAFSSKLSRLHSQSMQHEVQALQAKLLEQELKIQAAEENAMREMKPRKQAEEQIENLQGQITALEQRGRSEEVEVTAMKNIGKARRQSKEIIKLRRTVQTCNRTIKELEHELTRATKG